MVISSVWLTATHCFVDNKKQHVVYRTCFYVLCGGTTYSSVIYNMQCYCINSNNTLFMRLTNIAKCSIAIYSIVLTNIAKCSIAIYSIVQYLYFTFTYNTAKRRCDLDCSSFRYGYTPLLEYELMLTQSSSTLGHSHLVHCGARL